MERFNGDYSVLASVAEVFSHEDFYSRKIFFPKPKKESKTAGLLLALPKPTSYEEARQLTNGVMHLDVGDLGDEDLTKVCEAMKPGSLLEPLLSGGRFVVIGSHRLVVKVGQVLYGVSKATAVF